MPFFLQSEAIFPYAVQTFNKKCNFADEFKHSSKSCENEIAMPLTPEQIAKIRQKEAETPDALKRNPLNDYTEGWFHVTLNTRGEAPVLGYLTGDPNAEDGSENAPRCVLTELGRKVEESWNRTPSIYPDVEIIEFQVMPEHVHGLLHLLSGNKKHLGDIIKGFMIGCTHGYWDTLGIPWREMTYVKGVRTPQYNDRDHTHSFRGPALMVRGYNDVEAVTEEEIEIKRQYIRNNPRKRLITRSKPDRFCVMRNGHSENWTLQRALAAVASDPWIGRNPEKCRALQANVNHRLKRQPNDVKELAIDYVGNRALLSAGRKVSLICHRADAPLFEQQKEAVMKAAREGAVVVSAFISPKERDIMKQLMLEQLPFIELMDNGFSNRYKPGGKAFYSTAENRHVQMTCWTYVYRNDNPNDNLNQNGKQSTISREMCLVMNELVRIISDVKDDWWK